MSKRKRTTHRRKSHRSVAPPATIPADLDREMKMAELAMKVAREIAPRWSR